MFVDMINDPLMHLQSMRTTAHVRMDSHGEAETFLSFILVEVVEMVHPLLFEGCGVDLESWEVSLFLAEILNVFWLKSVEISNQNNPVAMLEDSHTHPCEFGADLMNTITIG